MIMAQFLLYTAGILGQKYIYMSSDCSPLTQFLSFLFILLPSLAYTLVVGIQQQINIFSTQMQEWTT